MKNSEDIFQLGLKALIQRSQGDLLLLRAKKGYWDLPGGRIHRGETCELALMREVQEETGIDRLAEISFFTMTISHLRIPVEQGDSGLIYATYLCKLDYQPHIQLSDEHVEFLWTSPKNACDLLETFPHTLTQRLHELSTHCSHL